MAKDPIQDRINEKLRIRIKSRKATLFLIGPGAFNPPPKVDSAFVRLVPHKTPVYGIQDHAAFGKTVTLAFSQRRKTLRNTLKPLLSSEQIAACGIDPGVRPEQLEVRDFVTLANRIGLAGNAE